METEVEAFLRQQKAPQGMVVYCKNAGVEAVHALACLAGPTEEKKEACLAAMEIVPENAAAYGYAGAVLSMAIARHKAAMAAVSSGAGVGGGELEQQAQLNMSLLQDFKKVYKWAPAPEMAPSDALVTRVNKQRVSGAFTLVELNEVSSLVRPAKSETILRISDTTLRAEISEGSQGGGGSNAGVSQLLMRLRILMYTYALVGLPGVPGTGSATRPDIPWASWEVLGDYLDWVLARVAERGSSGTGMSAAGMLHSDRQTRALWMDKMRSGMHCLDEAIKDSKGQLFAIWHSARQQAPTGTEGGQQSRGTSKAPKNRPNPKNPKKRPPTPPRGSKAPRVKVEGEICKQFQTGQCTRKADTCRFMHACQRCSSEKHGMHKCPTKP